MPIVAQRHFVVYIAVVVALLLYSIAQKPSSTMRERENGNKKWIEIYSIPLKGFFCSPKCVIWCLTYAFTLNIMFIYVCLFAGVLVDRSVNRARVRCKTGLGFFSFSIYRCGVLFFFFVFSFPIVAFLSISMPHK